MLQQILDQMFVDPELLAELSKDQKEILFHKIREEQIRRWRAKSLEMEAKLKSKPPAPKRIKWDQCAYMFEDKDDDAAAKEAARRASELERQREEEQLKEDERQARLLAELEIEQELERKKAEAERIAAEIRAAEEAEEKRRQEEAEREAKEREEREMYMTRKELKKAAEEEEKRKKQREAELKKIAAQRKKEQEKMEKDLKKQEKDVVKEAKKKEKEIYITMREAREQAKKTQKMVEAKMDSLYEERERQAKQADEEKRRLARLAREQAEKQQDSVFSLLEQRAKERAAAGPAPDGGPGAPPPIPSKETKPRALDRTASTRGSRPNSDDEVVQWWRAEEMPRGVGRDPSGNLRQWFHGIISRKDAEQLLNGQPVGAYLLRISTRIWGYTLSFVDTDRFKHFLVDAQDGTYSVFGTQASCTHKDLNTLIKFHEKMAVSKTGTTLSVPVGDARGNKSARLLMGS